MNFPLPDLNHTKISYFTGILFMYILKEIIKQNIFNKKKHNNGRKMYRFSNTMTIVEITVCTVQYIWTRERERIEKYD